MTHDPRKPAPFSPEDSRYMDGEMPPEQTRRHERLLASDPDRAEHVGALREAMEVWREDVERSARRADPAGDLADRILAAGDVAPRMARAAAPWYAAAALVLMAVGIGGTLMARSRASEPLTPPTPLALGEIDAAFLNLMVDSPAVLRPEPGRPVK